MLGIGGNTGVTQGPDGLFDHASRRSVAIDTFPIGIDPAPFERALDSSAVKESNNEANAGFSPAAARHREPLLI